MITEENPLRFQAEIYRLWGDGYSTQVVRISPAQAEALGLKAMGRVQGRINGTRFQLALQRMPGGEEGFYMFCSKNLQKEAGITDSSLPVRIEIWPDTSELGMEMPEELEAALVQDEAAWEAWQKQKPGAKRSAIVKVGRAKLPDTRIRYALEIAAHLAAGLPLGPRSRSLNPGPGKRF